VGVPFHSQYLRDAADKVIYQDLNGEELWTAEGLQIPVYHTENGSDLRAQTGSLTRSVCDQIFTKALHWPKATGIPEGTTHAVDWCRWY